MKKSIGSGRGSVYNILLKALQTGDKYGYEICKEIEEKTNGSYILKQASLYSGLKRLEAQGDITSYWQDSVLGGRRHYYSLTEKGKERIIRSNFSWTDARDDIVDNLFEKSQLDKEIEGMQNDLNSIQDNQVLSEENQKNIDYILENTANLGNEQKAEQPEDEENSENLAETEEKAEEDEESQETLKEVKEDAPAGFNFGGDDLFSMFNTTYENNEEKLEENQEDEEAIEKDEESSESEEVEEAQNNVFENAESKENEQLDLFSISNQQPIEEKAEAEEKMSDDEDDKDDGFADIMQNMQTLETEEENSFKDNLNDAEEDTKREIYEEYSEQNIEVPENICENKEQALDDEYVDKVAETYDLDKSVEETKEEQNQSVEENVIDEDETDDQSENVSLLQKNDVDVLEEYRKSHVSFNRFSESTQFEEPENTFSNFFDNNIFDKNEGDDKQDATLGQESVENKLNVEEKPKEENVFYYDLANNKEVEKEEVKSQKQTPTLDYKDIFGDLMSSKEEQTKEDSVQYNKENEAVSEENKTNTEEKEEIKPQERQNSFDDLPRIDSSMQDINRTFMQSKEVKEDTYTTSSNSFERYDSSPFETSDRNPFEKYDTYEPMDYANDSKNNVYDDEVRDQRTGALAFDKKYANIYNKFEVPDYEVRYFKKSTSVKNSQSKFVSINRLNLAVSCILCLLMLIATTVTLILSGRNPANGFQTTCYILSYILLALIILFDFTKYMLNKNKKAHTLNKNESLINLFLAIFVAILSISINLFLGMSFANITSYMGSFTLPLYYSLYLLVKFPLKKFLSKFANFYN